MAGSSAGPIAKIERAKHHLVGLTRRVDEFLKTNPYAVGTTTDTKAGNKLWVVTHVADTPGDIALAAGDVIHNARSALDLMFCQLVIANGKRPNRSDAFPSSDDFERFNTSVAPKIKSRISSGVYEAILTLEPYKGGNDELWVLHKLDIADKHRLILTLGSAYQSASLPVLKWTTKTMPGASDEKLIEINTMMDEMMASVFFNVADRAFPLKVGTPLLSVPISFAKQPHTEPQFRFELALAEEKVVEGEALISTLSNLVNKAETVIQTLAPLL